MKLYEVIKLNRRRFQVAAIDGQFVTLVSLNGKKKYLFDSEAKTIQRVRNG